MNIETSTLRSHNSSLTLGTPSSPTLGRALYSIAAVALTFPLVAGHTTSAGNMVRPFSTPESLDTLVDIPRVSTRYEQQVIVSPTNRLIAQVRELGTLDKGWHQPDSQPAPRRALEDAEAFLRSHEWEDLLLPIISLAEDGEINFYWSNENLYLDLGFFGDKTYSYYARLSDDTRYMKDDVPFDQSLPPHILDMLKAGSRV